MATKNAEIERVEIKPLDIQRTVIKVTGDTSLIMHAWNEKAKRMLANPKATDTADEKKVPRNPVESFITSMYWLTEPPMELTEEGFTKAVASGARFGFPVSAFKQAAISAAYRMGWSKDKASLRGAFFIDPNANSYYGLDVKLGKAVGVVTNYADLIEIKSDAPILREDMVRIGMGTADIRWRGEFRNWSAEFIVSYNKNGQYKLQEIVNFINAGGYVCGVGEWRPEKDGQNGMFHVELA